MEWKDAHGVEARMEAESSSSSPLRAIFQDVKAFARLHFLNFKSPVLSKNM